MFVFQIVPHISWLMCWITTLFENRRCRQVQCLGPSIIVVQKHFLVFSDYSLFKNVARIRYHITVYVALYHNHLLNMRYLYESKRDLLTSDSWIMLVNNSIGVKNNHQKNICNPDIRNLFSNHDNYAVEEMAGEEKLPGAVVAEILFSSETFWVFHVNPFVFLKWNPQLRTIKTQRLRKMFMKVVFDSSDIHVNYLVTPISRTETYRPPFLRWLISLP